MTFIRAAFLFALLTPIVGLIGARYFVTSIMGQAPQTAIAPGAPTARPTRTAAPTARPTERPTSPPTPRPTMSPTQPAPTAASTSATVNSTPIVRSRRVTAPSTARRRRAPVHVHRRRAHTRRVSIPTATATLQPSPTAGIITLARYWIGTTQARRDSTIEVGYVVDNETGRPARVMLGASIKSSRTFNWLTSAISDPFHDVVAYVPPGVSTHHRFFTLPARLRPGLYDVAWGLRDAVTGRSDAVVSAPAALRVGR